jgi:hypothetical protein
MFRGEAPWPPSRVHQEQKGTLLKPDSLASWSAATALTQPPLQIRAKIAFRLALYARILEGGKPALCGAVVLELPMGHRSVPAVIDVMQENPASAVPGHGESNGIGAAHRRHAGAAASVAEITEVAKGGVIRNKLFRTGAAGPAETAAQRQTVWEWPADREGLFRREEVWARHSRIILVPVSRIV